MVVVEFDGQELSVSLAQVAAELPDAERNEEQEARPAVLEAVQRYGQSRFDLGVALARYRDVFKKNGTWVRVCKVIGQHLGISDRTVMRIVEDHDRVADAHPKVLAAMKAEGYEPAALKNAELLKNALAMTQDGASSHQARQVVSRTAAFLKRSRHSGEMSQEERQIWGLRMDIRRRLNNVPDSHKEDILRRAIAHEAFDVWGRREPFTIEITPKKGTFSVCGRRVEAVGGAA